MANPAPAPTDPTTTTIASPQPLTQSTVYNQYLSILIVCIVSLYTTAYVARCLRWHYRRRRKRAMWLERGRLRLYWHRAIFLRDQKHHRRRHQIVEKGVDYDDERRRRKHPPSPPPRAMAMLPRPATFPSTTSTSTSTTLTCDDSLFSRPRSITFFNSPSSSSAASLCYTATSTTLHHPPVNIPPPVKQPWIYNNKRKRRRLMWQWSVAMGYCRYSHAARMEDVIVQTQQRNDNEKIDDVQNNCF